jgi:hypothetical protein
MALTYNGTSVEIPAAQLPTGYVKPVVTKFSDYEYRSEVTLNVLKSTVDNATETTTFANILTDGTIGLNKQVSDILTADLDTVGNTVDAYAELRSIGTNMVLTGGLYTDAATSYVCSVPIFAKTS